MFTGSRLRNSSYLYCRAPHLMDIPPEDLPVTREITGNGERQSRTALPSIVNDDVILLLIRRSHHHRLHVHRPGISRITAFIVSVRIFLHGASVLHGFFNSSVLAIGKEHDRPLPILYIFITFLKPCLTFAANFASLVVT